MFSMTPAMRWRVCREMVPARSATSAAAICGVVTISSSALGTSCATEMAMSPVPGGRSNSRTSRSPQKTSARNCWIARCSIGPRHTTGALSSTKWPMEISDTPWACGGMIMSSTWCGLSSEPIMWGTEWP